MLKENKGKLLISSVIILLPVLFGILMWNKLPETMTTHWGADGTADGFGGKVFLVFGMPFILLAGHLICLLVTSLDKKQKNQSRKAFGIIFWIVPCVSLFEFGIVYSTAFGRELKIESLTPVLFGILFIVMGNYMPKIRQNRTFGIRLPWTINNEENWNKTHRFGGKLWVVAGLIMLFSVFLPSGCMVAVVVCVIVASAVIPSGYSYYIYRQHRKAGIVYDVRPKSKAEKAAYKISLVVLVVCLIVAAVLLFTGDIKLHLNDDSFQIDASYWSDLEVEYSAIDSIAYRDELDVGVRTNGFGSFRLSMGSFKNDEFGHYTLYAYAGSKGYVVMDVDGKTLVIGMKEKETIQELYETILEKTSVGPEL